MAISVNFSFSGPVIPKRLLVRNHTLSGPTLAVHPADFEALHPRQEQIYGEPNSVALDSGSLELTFTATTISGENHPRTGQIALNCIVMRRAPQYTFEFEESDDYLVGSIPAVELEAVLYSSDWTVETLLSQLRQGNIEIAPTFQRRDAWQLDKKSRYIESLLTGLPVPQIVFAERERGRYLVLDGRQRLLALAQFAGLQIVEGSRNFAYRLRSLEILPELEGCSYDDLGSC